jgi:methylmalonyl-CoA mutase C-terminal domain/subunit
VLVFGGGIIPDDDMPELARLGVAKIFKPGASTQEIAQWVASSIKPRSR